MANEDQNGQVDQAFKAKQDEEERLLEEADRKGREQAAAKKKAEEERRQKIKENRENATPPARQEKEKEEIEAVKEKNKEQTQKETDKIKKDVPVRPKCSCPQDTYYAKWKTQKDKPKEYNYASSTGVWDGEEEDAGRDWKGAGCYSTKDDKWVGPKPVCTDDKPSRDTTPTGTTQTTPSNTTKTPVVTPEELVGLPTLNSKGEIDDPYEAEYEESLVTDDPNMTPGENSGTVTVYENDIYGEYELLDENGQSIREGDSQMGSTFQIGGLTQKDGSGSYKNNGYTANNRSDVSYGRIKSLMQQKGYSFLTGEMELNFIWCRNHMTSAGSKATNAFTDDLYIAFIENGKEMILKWKVTTKPGLVGSLQRVDEEQPFESGVRGTAIIKEGHYKNAWEFRDTYKEFLSYPYFRQVRGIDYYRDGNRDKMADYINIQKNKSCGTQWHKMSNRIDKITAPVNAWSQGCMGTILSNFDQIIDLTRRSIKVTNKKIFNGTILNENDFKPMTA